MKILVVNCGSSSVKYQLINMETEEVMASGKYERIGETEAFIVHKVNGEKHKMEHPAETHKEAIEFILEQLTCKEYGVINTLDEIDAVGHRIVHGGEKLVQSYIVDERVKQLLREAIDLAPLHNSGALSGIEVMEKLLPNTPMVTVYDTAFHQTIEKDRYMYPLPYRFYEKYGIRKYGFHGTSHMYVSQRLAEIEGKDVKDLKIVSGHLGQGSSICAVKGGKSVDTSMGFTPLGGLPMVTRCGDIDPSTVLYIMRKENMSAAEMEQFLNKKAGILSMTEGEGIAPDFREISDKATEGNEKAMVALNTFTYSIAQYIVRYMVAMGGIDYILFTGGIGENQANVREGVCNFLEFMGVELDKEKNKIRGEELQISTDNSKIKVFVVPTNEELMIAKETVRLINK